MISSLLVICLASAAQTPPKIHIVRDTQDEVTLETASGVQPLPLRTPVPLIPAPETVVRISTGSRRPLTIRTTDLLAADTWYVERLQPNGEVFLWASAGHVETPPAGSVIITAEAAACANAETFELGLMMPFGNRTSLPFLTTPEVARCRWIVIGLPAGSYAASLRNAHGSSGRRDFRAIAPETIEVTIPPPAVTVSGVVTLNGKAISNGRIQFRTNVDVLNFDLEADGSYHAAFDVDGPYTLSLLRPIGRLKPIGLTLANGPNTFDWNIEEPSADSELTVRVTGHERLEETGVQLQSNGVIITRVSIPAGEDAVTRTGLPFGKYRVFARQPSASSDWGDVELSASTPSVSIALSLTRATRSITLRDAEGEPVSNAGFADTSHPPEETSPGTYSLASFAVNTELMVRPPTGAPLCRVVPREGDIQATVLPGRSLTLKFRDRRISIDHVKIETDGCPVSIMLFLKTPLRVGPQTADVEVLNAPPNESLIIHTREGAHRVSVGADGVVFIP